MGVTLLVTPNCFLKFGKPILLFKEKLLSLNILFISLSSCQYSWLVHYVSVYESRLQLRCLPSMAYSEAYAYFMLSVGEGSCHAHKALKQKLTNHMAPLSSQMLR